jgi:hypothetical protein
VSAARDRIELPGRSDIRRRQPRHLHERRHDAPGIARVVEAHQVPDFMQGNGARRPGIERNTRALVNGQLDVRLDDPIAPVDSPPRDPTYRSCEPIDPGDVYLGRR